MLPRNVTTAVAGIAGFSTGFGQPSDRELGLLDIGAVASIDANTVTVELTFGPPFSLHDGTVGRTS